MQETTPANRTDGPTDWPRVNWRAANRRVRNLRHRIFRATQAGDRDKVQSLQRLMLRSYANTLVSVRRVTQRSLGRRTPGVDGELALDPAARGRLARTLAEQPWPTAKPVRSIPFSTMVNSSNCGVCPGSTQPPGLRMCAMLTASCRELTRPHVELPARQSASSIWVVR